MTIKTLTIRLANDQRFSLYDGMQGLKRAGVQSLHDWLLNRSNIKSERYPAVQTVYGRSLEEVRKALDFYDAHNGSVEAFSKHSEAASALADALRNPDNAAFYGYKLGQVVEAVDFHRMYKEKEVWFRDKSPAHVCEAIAFYEDHKDTLQDQRKAAREVIDECISKITDNLGKAVVDHVRDAMRRGMF